jgi:mono/diheme cytochrome c family protein
MPAIPTADFHPTENTLNSSQQKKLCPPMKHAPAALSLASVLLCAPAHSAPVDFVREVRPIFEKHCHSCHGPEKQKGGLRLDVKSAALKGGEIHAPNILPGKTEQSSLLTAVRGEDEDLKMPPKGERLSTHELATLARWIQEGAPWPESADSVQLADNRAHWCFQTVSKQTPPETANPAWPRNAADRFILARLEREGLQPSPEATRSAWLRRVSFDLTGLPPTPEQSADFEKDPSSEAYERVVDGLLNSPRYGEKWGMHWLDLVRYADTHGFEVNTERPNAWPYRDYVIRAFNADTPYDRFIREQIAGDLLGEDAATGFLVTASVLLPGQIGKDEPSKRLARQDALDEIVVNTANTFLAISIGCARCHNHKFDPITATDYYAMQSFFAGVEYKDRDLRTPEGDLARARARELRSKITEAQKKLASFEPLAHSGTARTQTKPDINVDRFAPVRAKKVRFTIESTNSLEPCLDELEVLSSEGSNVALASAGASVTASGQRIVADIHDLLYVNDGVYGNSRSWMSNTTGTGWVSIEFAREETIERVVWSRDRTGNFKDRLARTYRLEYADQNGEWRPLCDSSDRTRELPKSNLANKDSSFSSEGLSAAEKKEAERILSEKKAMERELASKENAGKVFAGVFREPDAIRVLNRGNPEQPKEAVEAAVPAIFGSPKPEKPLSESERRMRLSDWLSSPQNPLTARVMVNRIWQWHFGTGLVETPSDFGVMGAAPSHPELLDWLAGEFVRGGWSVKKLHKLIVLSATYRQSSQFNPEAAKKDAGGRLLWQFPQRRLEAESIRDAILSVSGKLDLSMYGRGYDLFDKRGGLSGFKPVESFSKEGLRRMIYAHKVRREPDAIFGAFDCPDAGLSTARRRESMTPIQALNLLNSLFTLEQAGAFAKRLQDECGDDPVKQVQRAYRIALGREADPAETQDATGVVREHGAAAFCRALFNSNEFLFLP